MGAGILIRNLTGTTFSPSRGIAAKDGLDRDPVPLHVWPFRTTYSLLLKAFSGIWVSEFPSRTLLGPFSFQDGELLQKNVPD